MSDVLPFPKRITVDVTKLAELLADARDLGFAEGMLEAGASDVQRWEAMLTRAQERGTLVRHYAAQLGLPK